MLKGYAEGGMDFIFKPLDPDLVRAKVDSFVRFYRLQKELERARENEKIHLKTIEEGEITYRQLIESAPDAIVVIDENSTITQWNGQAEGMFGWKNGQVIGESLVSLLIPERYRAMHIQGLLHFLETGEGPVLNKPIAVMALQKNGMEIPVEIKISVSKVNGKNSFTAFIRDISERKKSDQKGRNELLTNDQ
jgi:PAS domain S-box-containing protein